MSQSSFIVKWEELGTRLTGAKGVQKSQTGRGGVYKPLIEIVNRIKCQEVNSWHTIPWLDKRLLLSVEKSDNKMSYRSA